MADVSDVKSVTDLLSQVTDGFKDFFSNLEGTLEKLAGIPSILTGADNSLNKVTNSANDANKALDLTHSTSLNLIKAVTDFGADSITTFKAFADGSYQSVDAMGDVNETLTTVISSVGLLAVGGSNAFSALNDSSKYTTSNLNDFFIPVLNRAFNLLDLNTGSGLGKTIKDLAGNGVLAVDSINNLENSLLALHAQSGDLISTLDKTGSSQNNLTKLTDEYVASIKRTVDQTGASVNSVINYSKEILKIPGLYNDIIKTPLGENLSFTEAAMKATAGTTQDLGATLDIAKQQMLNFGNGGQASLELLSRMYSVGQSLSTPFSLIQNQVKQTADQFKFLGDNTQGALTIFNSLGEGLQKSKIGPAAMAEIVSDVTNSIGQLDIAQKSFLSAQSGGAGGLQGGYQIDQLLAEGKIDQVYKKIEGSLKQEFGGKITTLKEGSQDAGSAQQLTKEVAFLTQGPFGQVVKSSQEAYKLLEGFKTGLTTPKETPTENQLQAGLSKTLDVGTSLQQSQYTELQKISNNTEIFRLYAQKDLGQNVRDVTRTDLGKVATPTSLEESTKNAPSAGKGLLYEGTDIASGFKNVYNKIANSSLTQPTDIQTGLRNTIEPTPIETNATRNNENIVPQVQSPDINAQRNRNNLLRERQERPDTVEAGLKGDQTIIFKTQNIGLDGKTEERIIAKAKVETIKAIQTYDQNSATVGHQGHQ